MHRLEVAALVVVALKLVGDPRGAGDLLLGARDGGLAGLGGSRVGRCGFRVSGWGRGRAASVALDCANINRPHPLAFGFLGRPLTRPAARQCQCIKQASTKQPTNQATHPPTQQSTNQSNNRPTQTPRPLAFGSLGRPFTAASSAASLDSMSSPGMSSRSRFT